MDRRADARRVGVVEDVLALVLVGGLLGREELLPEGDRLRRHLVGQVGSLAVPVLAVDQQVLPAQDHDHGLEVQQVQPADLRREDVPLPLVEGTPVVDLDVRDQAGQDGRDVSSNDCSHGTSKVLMP